MKSNYYGKSMCQDYVKGRAILNGQSIQEILKWLAAELTVSETLTVTRGASHGNPKEMTKSSMEALVALRTPQPN